MNLFQNPLDPVLWTVRRSEQDVISLYNYLSGLMHISTEDYFLNFGYWNEKINSPREAQLNLCSLIADVSNLYSARLVLDIGSGFSVPAIYWKSLINSLNIVCLDVNLQQLKFGVSLQRDLEAREKEKKKITIPSSKDSAQEFKSSFKQELPHIEHAEKLSYVNATSTALLFMESYRVLEKNGIFVTAIPIIYNQEHVRGNNILSGMISLISLFFKLGILKFSWMSEHYDLDFIKSQIGNAGFRSKEIKLIGTDVYEPLSKYYIQNREKLQHAILKEYPSYVEKILYKSILKMNELSEERVIDYAIIRADK